MDLTVQWALQLPPMIVGFLESDVCFTTCLRDKILIPFDSLSSQSNYHNHLFKGIFFMKFNSTVGIIQIYVKNYK